MSLCVWMPLESKFPSQRDDAFRELRHSEDQYFSTDSLYTSSLRVVVLVSLLKLLPTVSMLVNTATSQAQANFSICQPQARLMPNIPSFPWRSIQLCINRPVGALIINLNIRQASIKHNRQVTTQIPKLHTCAVIGGQAKSIYSLMFSQSSFIRPYHREIFKTSASRVERKRHEFV